MERTGAIALGVALLVAASFPGCAGQAQGAANPQVADREGSSGFLVPESPLAYTAYYRVDEGGEQTDKVVFREGRKMRIAYVLGSANVSVFFLEDRAYSCANILGDRYSCFDITAQAASQGIPSLFGKPDLTDAVLEETVPVGETGQLQADCYSFSDFRYQYRKTCFTEEGIVAYDEYPISGGKVHVEYLTYLKIGTGLRDFSLPASPKVPPQNLSYMGG